jgi:hypothetical protein
MTEESESQQGGKRSRKDNGVSQAAMPQQMVIPDAESEPDHIQVWED